MLDHHGLQAPRRPKHPGCPAWIIEGVRRIREQATGKTQPTIQEDKQSEH